MTDLLTEINGVGNVTANKLRKAYFTAIVALAVALIRGLWIEQGWSISQP